jgi:ankyrin repeat protein
VVKSGTCTGVFNYCITKFIIMKNENKVEVFLKLIKAKNIKINDITNLVKNSILDYDKLDSNGYNLLHYAIKRESPEVVYLLLNSNGEFSTNPANPNIATADHHNAVFLTPMHLALNTCNDGSNAYKIFKALHKAGGDIKIKDEDDCSIFHLACEKGRSDVLNYLFTIDGTQNINELCKYGSGLHMALLGDQDDVIPFLLDMKIDISIKDSSGNTTLHLAIQLKQFNNFKTISDYIVNNMDMANDTKKAIYNAINDEGNTILHELAFAKSSVLIDYLKKMDSAFKVDEDITNKQGYTYKGVQENVVRIQKEREQAEKIKRELIKLEKEKIIEERRKADEALLLEQEKENQQEERRKQIGNTLLKYRSIIFAAVFCLFMCMLYYFIYNRVHRKKEIII